MGDRKAVEGLIEKTLTNNPSASRSFSTSLYTREAKNPLYEVFASLFPKSDSPFLRLSYFPRYISKTLMSAGFTPLILDA